MRTERAKLDRPDWLLETERNEPRQRRGLDLIEYYTANEEGAGIEDFRDMAVDAITDILHALELRNEDPDAAATMAMRHFQAETR